MAHRPVGMRLGLLTLVAATALLLAASTSAARPKPVRFAVSIKATAQVQWALAGDTLHPACGMENGSGTESSTYWTPRPFEIGPIELTGRMRDPFEAMHGETTRSGSVSTTVACSPAPWDPAACGT